MAPDDDAPVAPPPASPAGPPSAFRRRAMLILWPAFVAAGVLTMLTFVVVDPATLAFFGEAPLDWPRSAVYTVTFFLDWGVIATAGAFTALLETLPQPVGPTRPWRRRRPAIR